MLKDYIVENYAEYYDDETFYSYTENEKGAIAIPLSDFIDDNQMIEYIKHTFTGIAIDILSHLKDEIEKRRLESLADISSLFDE